jgi:hypothetical protein
MSSLFLCRVKCKLSEGIMSEGKLLNDFPLDKMLLDNEFKDFRCAGVIPRSLRVNHGNGAMGANTQAVGLGAENERFGAHEIQFLETAFKKLPGFEAFFPGSTFGLARVGAEENMPAKFFEAKGFRNFLQ